MRGAGRTTPFTLPLMMIAGSGCTAGRSTAGSAFNFGSFWGGSAFAVSFFLV